VTIVKPRIRSPAGERQVSHNPAMPIGNWPVRRLSVAEAEASLAALVAQRPTLDANVSRCRPDSEDARAEYSRRRKVEHPSERFVPAIVRSPMKNEKLQICVFCLCHFLYICGGAGTFAAAD
jgi:hypothetical protein